MKLWGNQHRWSKTGCYWTFEFTVAHGSVFNNGVSELGALWGDSHGVPMILVGGELPTLRATLDTGDAHRNIHWTIINHDHT